MSSSRVSKPGEVNCLVTHTGVVSCVIPGSYSGQCLSDYKAFPYDTHKCTLKFGTLLNTVDDILFTNFTVDTVHLYENNQWLLHKTNSGIRNKLRRKLSDDGNAAANASPSFQEMFCEVTFQRHSAMLESTMVIPMLGKFIPMLVHFSVVQMIWRAVIDLKKGFLANLCQSHEKKIDGFFDKPKLNKVCRLEKK